MSIGTLSPICPAKEKEVGALAMMLPTRDRFSRIAERDWVAVRGDGSITHIIAVPADPYEPDFGCEETNGGKVIVVAAAIALAIIGLGCWMFL